MDKQPPTPIAVRQPPFHLLPSWFINYAEFSRKLVASNWAATNVHITERSWDERFASLTIPHMRFWNITHLTVEVEYIAPDGDTLPSRIRSSSNPDLFGRNSLTSLKIINLNPGIALTIPENFITREDNSGNPTYVVEIRGPLRTVHKEAFHFAQMKELHLDPDHDGNEHRLTFHRYVRPPEGTGWCTKSCE